MLQELEVISYQELDKLGLLSLECQKLRGDVIEADKIMIEIDSVDGQNLCPKKCQKLEGTALR